MSKSCLVEYRIRVSPPQYAKFTPISGVTLTAPITEQRIYSSSRMFNRFYKIWKTRMIKTLNNLSMTVLNNSKKIQNCVTRQKQRPLVWLPPQQHTIWLLTVAINLEDFTRLDLSKTWMDFYSQPAYHTCTIVMKFWSWCLCFVS